MEKLIVYPADEKQATALKEVLLEMQIEYSAVVQQQLEEVEDDELVHAMKEAEAEIPLSQNEQAEFFSWVKMQS